MAEALRERPALAAPSTPRSSGTGPNLVERPGLCLIQIIARPSKEREVARILGLELPTRPNTTASDGEITIFCLRPRDWLIATPDAEGRKGGVAVEARKRLAGFAAAIDQSHGRVTLRLAGEGARALLQQGCNLDLDISAFPPGAMAQTGINGIALMVHCLEPESFDLYVARSFASDLARWLEHHGALLTLGSRP